MAGDFGLFIGFGTAIPGREQEGLKLFGEALDFWSQKQQQGEVESVDTVLLEPHGGDLNGFILIHGDQQKLNRIRYQDETFLKQIAQAQVMVHDIGVVGAYIGAGVQQEIQRYQQVLQSLQPAMAGAR